jgi:hypothetical protein
MHTEGCSNNSYQEHAVTNVGMRMVLQQFKHTDTVSRYNKLVRDLIFP